MQVSAFLLSLKTMRDEKRLVDFTIEVGDSKFEAHGIVLAARSGYFNAILQHDVVENRLKTTKLDNIRAPIMSALLDYMYIAEIQLTTMNVKEILDAAHYLQVDDAIEKCCIFIEGHINENNCLALADYAITHSFTGIKKLAIDVCYEKFEELAGTPEILRISDTLLVELISSDKLNVSDETLVLELLNKWVVANPDKEMMFEQLVRHVRLVCVGLIAGGAHTEAKVGHDNVSDKQDVSSELSNKLLAKAKIYKPLKSSPRNPAIPRGRIILVSSASDDWRKIGFCSPMHVYNPTNEKLEFIGNLPISRSGAGLAILGNSLYVVGGLIYPKNRRNDGAPPDEDWGLDANQETNGDDSDHYEPRFPFIPSRSVQRYDLDRRKWFSDVARMIRGTEILDLFEIDGLLYAVGLEKVAPNSDGWTSMTKFVLNCYNPETNTWSDCSEEPHLASATCQTFGHITIKKTNQTDHPTDWIFCIRSRLKMNPIIPLDGKLYGWGYTRSDMEAYFLSFDSKTKRVTRLSKPNVIKFPYRLVELDGFIYAFGGIDRDGRRVTDVIEVYDPATNRWEVKKEYPSPVGFTVVAYHSRDHADNLEWS